VTVTAPSSYVRYLPRALWADEDPAAPFTTGGMLRIFEKLLTGIDDDAVMVHGDHEHEPVATVIDRLHRLFDPWRSPPDFLDWLASWVALEFSPMWDEYQRRKLLTEIVGFYAERGLKAGLDRYLDLYTVAATRPRITVDDSAKVLVGDPVPGRIAPLSTLVSQGPFIRADGTTAHEGLVRPLCIAAAPDGSLLVGDDGSPGTATAVRPGVWRISGGGAYEFDGKPPIPRPLGPPNWVLAGPVALAVEPGSPWRLYVLDGTPLAAQTALYRLSAPQLDTATPLATVGQLGAVAPVGMAMDPLAAGRLLVLDRGGAGTGLPPRVLSVDVQASAPAPVTATALTGVTYPLSLAVEANGDLLIGDGGAQTGTAAANLVRVDRSNAAAWVATTLLPAANPLVAPTAIVRHDATRLLVLDAGLKPLYPAGASPFIRDVAEPAGVWWVEQAGATPALTPAVEPRRLVFPAGMALDGRTVHICDGGEPAAAGVPIRPWRMSQHEFGVLVHFSSQRPTTLMQRAGIVQSIRELVNAQKPAQTHWTVVSAI
jgi:phage tail-like protein